MDALTVIATADSFRTKGEPPLTIGARVRLNSGGPILLIVDIDCGLVVAAWQAGKVIEMAAPECCFHRVKCADDASE